MADENKQTPPAQAGENKHPVPEPVNMIDGVPDSAPRKPGWFYLALGGVFVLWLAFLLYVYLAV
jgi:hypothetical protein